MSKYTEDDLKIELENKEYEYGFYTELDSETFPIGLNEDIVRAISKKKEEPQWMTDWRIEAFRAWEQMVEPEWANVTLSLSNEVKTPYLICLCEDMVVKSNKKKVNACIKEFIDNDFDYMLLCKLHKYLEPQL